MRHLNSGDGQHRAILQDIARRAMLERGLLPGFSPAALAELDGIQASSGIDGGTSRDLKHLPWCSIDNDDSRDLDQLTVAQATSGDDVRILVAIADVDALVRKGSALDEHARRNTTSVYTAALIFPMLPAKLSTDLTSLNVREERTSIVIEMALGADGSVRDSTVYRARVLSQAKLAYSKVGAWLEGAGTVPEAVAAVDGLAGNLRIQDRVAQSMKRYRHAHGALSLETVEVRPVFDGDALTDLKVDEKNRATTIIEDFMIAANGVAARFLASKGSPSIRRVVRTPNRWDRIVEIAAERKFSLPEAPDAKALEAFLTAEKAADPFRFPDLSLTVIKLLGPGEYVAQLPGDTAPGHFGLAVKDYGHSTAPNRRYTDLVTQRLLKAALDGESVPYDKAELQALATHCTQEEDAARKVERQVGKSAAALLLRSRSGEEFNAIVTGAAAKGTWARLLTLPVEGRLIRGFEGLDVGHRVRVRLVSVDVERGYIDLERVGP